MPRARRFRSRTWIGVAAALLLMELVVRQVYWRPMERDPDFSTVVLPGTTVKWGIEGFGTSRWTEHGLRRSEPPARETPPYLVLGDSFTEALMIEDEDVFSQRLERLLAGTPSAALVLNRGASGASAADYVALAPRYQELFAPRWTIVQLRDDDLGVDAWKPEKPHFVPRATGGFELDGRYAPLSSTWALQRPFRQHSTLANYGIVRFQKFALAAREEPPLFRAGEAAGRKAPEPDPSERYPVLEELQRIHDAYAGRVTFLWLPDFDLSASREPTTATERLWHRACAERGWSCVSLRDAFPSFAARFESPYGFANSFWNRGHMNTAGHHAAAELLQAEISRLAALDLL